MEKIKVGLIRVVTLQDEKLLNAHADILRNNFENLIIETKCISEQPEGIHDTETEKIAVPKILALAGEFERKGVDVIFISCAADPGVETARKFLKIPVIGAGSACASIALSLGNKIGTLGITDKAPEAMAKILGDKLIFNAKPENVNTTMDLLSKEGRENALKTATLLQEKGCDTIALSCTGISTIGLYQDMKRNIVPRIVDPVLAAGILITYLRL